MKYSRRTSQLAEASSCSEPFQCSTPLYWIAEHNPEMVTGARPAFDSSTSLLEYSCVFRSNL